MSLAFDPFDSVLLVLDTDGVHAVAADGTVSPVSFAAGSLPGHLYRIAVGADGAMYSTDQQASVVTLTRRG